MIFNGVSLLILMTGDMMPLFTSGLLDHVEDCLRQELDIKVTTMKLCEAFSFAISSSNTKQIPTHEVLDKMVSSLE